MHAINSSCILQKQKSDLRQRISPDRVHIEDVSKQPPTEHLNFHFSTLPPPLLLCERRRNYCPVQRRITSTQLAFSKRLRSFLENQNQLIVLKVSLLILLKSIASFYYASIEYLLKNFDIPSNGNLLLQFSNCSFYKINL